MVLSPTLLALLRHVSWREVLHHPLRHAVAALAVALGVALAFSVHLINASALGEFSAAVRQVNGQPDLELRGGRAGFDEAVYARVAAHPQVELASPVLEIETQARGADGQRFPIRIVGLDALAAAPLLPALLPQPAAGTDRLAAIDPGVVFVNDAARTRLGRDAASVRVDAGSAPVELPIAGRIAAGGTPLAVIDIAGAQQQFGRLGRLSRIDLRLVPGADRAAVLATLALPEGVRAVPPGEAEQRVSNLSRAYRVNLTVLALVALFTGAFLVFSILALSVAQRLPQIALLGVLGLSAPDRLRWVLAECVAVGLIGSALGLLLGTGLAQLALVLLAGDLGGAYFPGVQPTLQFSWGAAAVYGALGIVAALAGGWLPARSAQRIAPAQALKGLGDAGGGGARPWVAPLLIALGAVLALLPPVGGLPLPAYVAVALLLLGGIAGVPAVLGLLLARIAPPRHPLALLAVERARHQRSSATIAVAGVVASLALSAALTVMVASFRDAVADWLDDVLPADLYARSATSSAMADTVFLPEALVAGVRALPGVALVETQRLVPLAADAARPPVVLIARPLDADARALPLIGNVVNAPAGATAVWISEPMARLYALAPGDRWQLPLPDGRRVEVFVRGTWRDYARQHGALAIDRADWQRLTGDTRSNDLALWLAPGADMDTLRAGIRALAGDASIEFASTREIRAVSLRIFDRSFAVTYWLQAVAIVIGLVGIAASFSAQVLARRREFGLLAHLGLTRRQILAVVAGEGAVWSGAGALVGLALGIAVAVVLVHVVNPQSFHWSMELRLPLGRLAALAGAVLAAGTLTAWWAGRAAASRQAALAVKDDW
jgi:putative ABC transport system permease protein